MAFSVRWTSRVSKQLLKIPKKRRLLITFRVEANLDGYDNPKSTRGVLLNDGGDGHDDTF